MTETDLMKHAKTYIDKLANGIDPLTNEKVADSDIVNNVRISRCLFYVSDVLGKVIYEKEHPSVSKGAKRAFFLPDGKVNEYVFPGRNVSLSEIVAQLNGLADLEQCKKLTYNNVADWLVNIGALSVVEQEGKKCKIPTQKGRNIGITTEVRSGYYGGYTAVLYNTDAQHFIIENLDAVLSAPERNDSGLKTAGVSWTEDEDNHLGEMSRSGMTVPEIAANLSRTETAVSSRLVKLGLVPGKCEVKNIQALLARIEED